MSIDRREPGRDAKFSSRKLRDFAVTPVMAGVLALTGCSNDGKEQDALRNVIQPPLNGIGAKVLTEAQGHPNLFHISREPDGDTVIEADTGGRPNRKSVYVVMGSNPDNTPNPSATKFADVQNFYNLGDRGLGTASQLTLLSPEGETDLRNHGNYDLGIALGDHRRGDPEPIYAGYYLSARYKDGVTDGGEVLDSSDSGLYAREPSGGFDDSVGTARDVIEDGSPLVDRTLHDLEGK